MPALGYNLRLLAAALAIQHPTTDAQIDEASFWQYQKSKSQWRRHMHKPTRKLRRVVKRKGKGDDKRD